MKSWIRSVLVPEGYAAIAGARALLVSHWAVRSEATVSLITKAFDAQNRDPNIGRAAALRQSMTALITSADLNPSRHNRGGG